MRRRADIKGLHSVTPDGYKFAACAMLEYLRRVLEGIVISHRYANSMKMINTHPKLKAGSEVRLNFQCSKLLDI